MISNLLDIRGYFFIPDSMWAAQLSFMVSVFSLWVHKLGFSKDVVKLMAWFQLLASIAHMKQASGGRYSSAEGSISSYSYNHFVLIVVMTFVLLGRNPIMKIIEIFRSGNSVMRIKDNEALTMTSRWFRRNGLKMMWESVPIALAISIVYVLICRLVYSF